MIKVSIKNALRNKTIAVLASLGVGFGLMLVFVIGSFTAGVRADFQNSLSQTIGLVEVIETDEIGANSHLPLAIPGKIFNTPNVGDSISAHNVETQAPVYFTSSFNSQLRNVGDTLTLIGINISIDQKYGGVSTKLINGRLFNIGVNETIIDSRLIDIANFSVDIGNFLEIKLDPGGINTSKLEIVGTYSQEDLGAPPFVPREYYIYTDIQTVWNLLKLAKEPTEIYTAIYLRFNVETTQATKNYVEKINDYSKGGGYSPTFLTAFSLAAFLESIEDTFSIFDSFATIIGLITVIAGGMAIIVTQLMSVTSRLKEFAILKATGWKNRHIFLNVIIESLTLGLLGAFIGLAIGTLFIFFLSSGSSPFGISSAKITIPNLLQVIAYALGLGILGGLYPGIKAARVRPVVVLKGE
ncbi:MAG: FtsX-like permease family protein [Candidatus Lokiarchaeota archaeon]